jgi:hypothetical protein
MLVVYILTRLTLLIYFAFLLDKSVTCDASLLRLIVGSLSFVSLSLIYFLFLDMSNHLNTFLASSCVGLFFATRMSVYDSRFKITDFLLYSLISGLADLYLLNEI